MTFTNLCFLAHTKLVRSPGFEPGLPAWEASVLTKLDYDREQINIQKYNIKAYTRPNAHDLIALGSIFREDPVFLRDVKY